MKYASEIEEKTMAKALGIALPISRKKTVELCKFIKGRQLTKAIMLLEKVREEKVAIPFTRFGKGGTGHKPGIGPGRYPKKACFEVIKLLKQVEANARFKGLDTTSLVIKNALARQGAQSFHYGRKRRRKMKRTHVEVVVAETVKKTAAPKAKPKVETNSKPAAKPEQKKAEKPAQTKEIKEVKKK
jgi:large subunit ribosomal protein L22